MGKLFDATLDRLISNIPAACEILEKAGHTNLAGQLKRDRANLVYWREVARADKLTDYGRNDPTT